MAKLYYIAGGSRWRGNKLRDSEFITPFMPGKEEKKINLLPPIYQTWYGRLWIWAKSVW